MASAAPAPAAAARRESTATQDEDICRVCRCEGTAEQPLFFPCKCTGSIRFIHQECLLQWLKHSKKRYCELCNHEFEFQPVYAEGMPQRLSAWDLCLGVVRSLGGLLQSWGRIGLVAACWGVLLPVIARWTWQFFFEVWLFPWERPNPWRRLAWDWLEGGVVGLVVFFLALGCLGLRDFIVANAIPFADPWEGLADEAEMARAIGEDHVDDGLLPILEEEDEGRGERAPANQGVAGQAAAPETTPLYAASDESEWETEDEDIEADGDLLAAAWADQQARRARQYEHHADLEARALQPQPQPQPAGPAQQPRGDGFAVLPNGAVVAAVNDQGPEPMDDRRGAAVAAGEEDEDFLDGDFADEMPLDELLGLVGPVNQLVDNFLWIIVLNAVVIAVFAFAPYQLGNAYMYAVGQDNGNKLVPAAIGYGLVTLAAFAYLVAKGPAGPNPSTHTRILNFSCVFVKVCSLLSLEVVIVPLLNGVWLDICALELQNTTFSERKALFLKFPRALLFLHWMAGMVFMHNFSSFISVLRLALRPGVLWFLRDPNDPDFHPLRQMLEKPLPAYVRRMVLVCMMYGASILLLVWLPVKICLLVSPSLLPFNLTLQYPFEMLSFSLAIPLVQDGGDPTTYLSGVLASWLSVSAKLLDLTSFLLPGPPDQEVHRPPMFGPRLVLFTCISWLQLACVVSLLLLVPVSIGRALVALVLDTTVHEAYTFVLGGLVVYAGYLLVTGACSMRASLSRAHQVLETVSGMVRPCAKLAVFAVAFGVLLPILLGLLLDLVFITPLFKGYRVTPVYSAWQSWAMGVMAIELVRQAAFIGQTNAWKQAVRDLFDNGVANFDLGLAALPMAVLAFSLALPYVVVYGLLAQFASPLQVAMIYSLIYPTLLSIALCALLGHYASTLSAQMYEQIRDQKYLVGEQLLNWPESRPVEAAAEGDGEDGAASPAATRSSIEL